MGLFVLFSYVLLWILVVCLRVGCFDGDWWLECLVWFDFIIVLN